MKPLAVACALAGVLCAQQFKINLDHLEAKASSKVDLAFDSTWLRFGGTFMDSKDPDEAKAKKIISGLEGLYVKHFEFKTEGQYTQGDVDQIRNQLKPPEWSRLVGIKSAEDGENLEVWVRSKDNKASGVAIIAADPRSLTVVNLVGNVDLESLAALGGRSGIPKMKKK